MVKVGITQYQYVSSNGFDDTSFIHIDGRLIDRMTKLAIHTARLIYEKGNCKDISPERLGIAVSTETGAIDSIFEYCQNLRQNGYKGVNPSKFPNIMLSTCLSRIAKEVQAMGPSIPFYSDKGIDTALQYSVLQIKKQRCDAMMLFKVSCSKDCFGMLIENAEFSKHRCRDIKLLLDL
ncbi:MAG: hypothetical protein ACOZCL_02020 [Bacillota bacterium]